MDKFLGISSPIDTLCMSAVPVWGRERFLTCVGESVALQPRGAAEIGAFVSGFCALQASVVEELSAFMFRTKSLSKMYRQENFFAFNQKNTHM